MNIQQLMALCEKIKIRMMYDEIMYETAGPWLEVLDRYMDQAIDYQNREVYEMLWDLKTAICFACAEAELNAAIELAQANGEW